MTVSSLQFFHSAAQNWHCQLCLCFLKLLGNQPKLYNKRVRTTAKGEIRARLHFVGIYLIHLSDLSTLWMLSFTGGSPWSPDSRSSCITLICRGFSVSEKSPQGKANQPLDRVNVLAVLCSEPAYWKVVFQAVFIRTKFFILPTTCNKRWHPEQPHFKYHSTTIPLARSTDFQLLQIWFQYSKHAQNRADTAEQQLQTEPASLLAVLMEKQCTTVKGEAHTQPHWPEKEQQLLSHTSHSRRQRQPKTRGNTSGLKWC